MAQLPIERQREALKAFVAVAELPSDVRVSRLNEMRLTPVVRQIVDSLLAHDAKSGVFDDLNALSHLAARTSLSIRTRDVAGLAPLAAPDSLRQIVAETECITTAELEQRLAELELVALGQPRDFRTSGTSSIQLLDRLVAEGTITPFQSERLLRTDWRSLRIGKYLVLRELGRGGMGVVYHARHCVMEREVALKVIAPNRAEDRERRERFRTEAIAAARLRHPNIIAAYDADFVDSKLHLAMELVQGQDLATLVAVAGPLPIAEAVDVLFDAAKALEHAHSHGVIHRDVKPANLLVTSDGDVKLLDLGLALLQEEEDEEGRRTRLTCDDTVMGTIDFMSPEQAVGSRHADARSDIYSLGMTLYWLLTAQPAFEGDTAMARLVARRERPPPRLSDVRPDAPPWLAELFARMCERYADDRIQTMARVVSALAAGRDSLSVPAHASPPIVRPKRRFAFVLAGALAVIAFLVALGATTKSWWSASRRDDNSRPFAKEMHESDRGASAALHHTAPPVAVFPASTNGCLLFDGVDDGVHLPFGADGQSPLTLEAWVTPLVPAYAPATIISNSERSGFKLEWVKPFERRELDVRDRYCFTTYDGDASTRVRAPADLPVAIGKRTHIAGVWQQNSARLFIDGKLQSGARVVKRHVSSPLRFLLGANPTYVEGNPRSVPDYGFPGLVDEVRVSSVARYGDADFAPSERFEPDSHTIALYHCDEQSGDKLVDASDAHNDGQIVGAQRVDEAARLALERKSVGGASLLRTTLADDPSQVEFDGTKTISTMIDLDRRRPLTLEMWILPAATPMTDAVVPFIALDGSLYVTISKDEPRRWATAIHDDATTIRGYAEMGTPVRWDHVAHLAVVFDGAQLRTYEDGRLGCVKQIAAFTREIATQTTTLTIGAWSSGQSGPFRGRLYALRVSNAARYSGFFFEPPRQFVADDETALLLEGDAIDGSTLRDASANHRHATVHHTSASP